jgi:hypothetical protein
MMDMLRRYPLISALTIVAVVLAAVLAVELASGAALRERMAAAAAPRAAVVQTKLLPTIAAVNPDQEYAETGNRPLFTPTRRPAPAQVTPTTASAMNKGQFILTGVTIAGPMKIALLREKASGRVVRVEQGKDVNGITVAQIDPEQVTLTQGGDQEVVQLLVTKGVAAPPVPPQAAAPSAGPFAPSAGAAPAPPQPGANPALRAQPPVSAPAPPGAPRPVNPNTLFGPRPGGLTPGNSFVPDPTTVTPPTSDAAPLSPEELLARRRARRNQQTQ